MKIGYKVKAVNHKLYDAITKKYKTVSNYCNIVGLSKSLIYLCVNLKTYPKDERILNILEKTLNITRKKLFPDDLKIAINSKVKTDLYLKKEVDFKLLNYEDIKTIENNHIDRSFNIDLEEKKEKLYIAMEKHLNIREIEILKFRFGLEGDSLTYEEIAKKFRITRERIRQIEMKAQKKLRIFLIESNSLSKL